MGLEEVSEGVSESQLYSASAGNKGGQDWSKYDCEPIGPSMGKKSSGGGSRGAIDMVDPLFE